MLIKVESCWSGNSRFTWRLTLPDGRHEHLPQGEPDRWNRAYAIAAKDTLCALYGVPRKSIRFNVR